MQPHSKLYTPKNVHLVGCGGVGSWVAPALVRLLRGQVLHLWDGDKLERRNLDRQLFPQEFIGRNKAAALALVLRYPAVEVHEQYFHGGVEMWGGNLILCCADNHAARKACLSKADEMEGAAIISGNEYTDADAYIYFPWMRDTKNDPRVFAPSIMTEEAGDPLAPAGCTGAAAESNPQLVLANFAAADHLLRLMWWWFAETSSLDKETMPFWPVMHRTSASRASTILMKDRL